MTPVRRGPRGGLGWRGFIRVRVPGSEDAGSGQAVTRASSRRPPDPAGTTRRATRRASPTGGRSGASPPPRVSGVKLGFVGLGTMGAPMAGHLAAAGHEVTVANRTAAKAEAWVARHPGRAAP